MKKKKHSKSSMSFKRKISFFLVYMLLFSVLSAMVDYYAYDIINPWIFIVLSLIGALWATSVHVKSHTRSKVDELAKDVEKIL